MKNLSKYITLCICSAILFNACKKKEDAPIVVEPPIYSITPIIPSGWPQPVYNYASNTLSDAGFKLGRKLFYDVRLSSDNSISCGSCHQQFAGFANSAHGFSHGVNNTLGTRNAPALFNLNWHPSFMWDGGVNHIEVLPLAPITNPVEMGENMNSVIAKLSTDNAYRQLFTDAFGDNTINSQRIFRALAQFQGMLVSYNSKYDKHARGESDGVFTTSEETGLTIFTAKCASCHTPPLFTDFSFRNNGLSYNTALKDSGRAKVTGLTTDSHKFKVPSLRNINVTAPYMHDGRFTSLAQCLNHYATGVQHTQNLDTLLTNGIPLTAQDQLDLTNFLKTLTDNVFMKDERFKDPN
ncbi:MAG: cytochrome c peroxidase [Bacteroidia bacterium]